MWLNCLQIGRLGRAGGVASVAKWVSGVGFRGCDAFNPYLEVGFGVCNACEVDFRGGFWGLHRLQPCFRGGMGIL